MGGTLIMLKDHLSPEQRAAIGMLEAMQGTHAMADLKTAVAEINKRAEALAAQGLDPEKVKEFSIAMVESMQDAAGPKMTPKEREAHDLDLSERMVVRTLFPDLFDKYLS